MCLGFDVVKSFSFFFGMRTVVWTTYHVGNVCVEGCDGLRLDVCPVVWMRSEDGGTENDDVERMEEPLEEKLEPKECDPMPVMMEPLGSWEEQQLKAFLAVVLS